MKHYLASAFLCLGLLAPAISLAQSKDLTNILPDLKDGGYVLVMRHTATDPAQQDVVPFDFQDMAKQRQLSEEGRADARALGAAFQTLSIPIGHVHSSQLNRAMEAALLITGKTAVTMPELTDSSGGQAGAMDNPDGGGNLELGEALRIMADTLPDAGTNTLIVTHKTNIRDAFGTDWEEVKEGEVSIFQPSDEDGPQLIGRFQLDDWQ